MTLDAKTVIVMAACVGLITVYLVIVFARIDCASRRESELTVEEEHAETKPETQAQPKAATTEQTQEPSPEYDYSESEKYFRHYLNPIEFDVACKIVEGEAEDQDYIGKALVAQCILNACEKDGIEPSEVRTAYKYAGWKEEVSTETMEAVLDVFTFGKLQTDKQILYFYDPRYCDGEWHETQNFALEYGCHRFFEEAS